MLCLTREDMPQQKPSYHGVIPPKDLVRTLFTTYSKVFQVNHTEHTVLYYLYQLEQIRSNYRMIDMV